MAPTSRPISIILAATSENAIPRRLELGERPIILGRASKNEARTAAPSAGNALFECQVVSREHAAIAVKRGYEEDEITITDQDSTHGTSVNGQELKAWVPFTLQDGDMIQLGASVTRGTDIYEGVTVVFKRGDNDSRDDLRSNYSTYSVPEHGWSDALTDCSEADHDELDELDHEDYDDDANSAVDDGLDADAMTDYGEEPEDSCTHCADETELKDVGSQHKPIDLETWPTGSLRKVLDLTVPPPPMMLVNPFVQLPSMQVYNQPCWGSSATLVASTASQPTCTASQGLDQTQTKSLAECRPVCSDVNSGKLGQSGPFTAIRQASVELSTPRETAFITAPTQDTVTLANKPRYDPVRGTPPASSATLTAGSNSVTPPAVANPAEGWMNQMIRDGVVSPKPPVPCKPLGTPQSDSQPQSTMATIVTTDSCKSPRPPSMAAQEATHDGVNHKKRKADETAPCSMNDEEFEKLLESLLHSPPKKKAKTKKTSSRLQSFISDARKYAFGAALGATGTFTLLASPLGGALADWASKF